MKRRTFIKTSIKTAAAGYCVGAGNFSRKAFASTLQKPAVACIGVGGKGASDAQIASHYANIVALCDVDRTILDGAAATYTGARPFVDFFELFAEMQDKFDAVTVSTPDHMHAAITAKALMEGKHCYTQKPLTRTVGEARSLGRLAAKSSLCTQMGNKGSSLDSMRNLVAQIRAGVIGEVQEVHIWTNRPVWPQGPNRGMTLEKFCEQIRRQDPEIAGDEIAEKKKLIGEQLAALDWPRWLGTAPWREFWPGLYHPFAWRGWWDFGSGALGDMACHTANMPYSAADLKNPLRVAAESSGHDGESFPAAEKIRFDFPAADRRGAISAWWYDGGMKPNTKIFDRYKIDEPVKSGSLLIGDKGCAYAPNDYAQSYLLLHEGGEKMDELAGVDYRPAPSDTLSGNFDARHQYEWWYAIEQGKPDECWSNFERHAGPLTETVLLGNLAVWTAREPNTPGETIEWDAASGTVKNLAALKTPGVERLVRPIYADPYPSFDWDKIDAES